MIGAIGGNTFRCQIGGNEVRIGDAKSADFKPSLYLPKWGGECWISLALPTTEKQAVSMKEGWLKANTDTIHQAWKPTPILEDFNDAGGMDWAFMLMTAPERAYLEFEYDSHQVAAYHQPELTLEEVKQGCVRPEHVINSVAFYHSARAPMHRSKSDAEKYRTCKVGHLYRVKVQDAKGHTTWADWSVERDGILRLSVDPTWLAAAVYPVVLAPAGDTFGYTSVGGSAEALSGSTFTWAGYLAAAPADGSVTAIHSHMRHNTDGYYVRGIMANTTPAIVTNGIGTAGVPFAYSGSTSVWHELPFASSPSVTKDTSYYIGWCSDTASGTWRISYDGGGTRKIGTCDYAAPDTITVTSTSTDREYSIYCTYTPSGGGNVYEVSCTDGIKFSDTTKANMVMYVACTDGLKAGDAPAGPLTMPVSCSDGVVLSDAAARTLTIPLSCADGLVLSDAPAAQTDFHPSCADGLVLSDTTAARMNWLVSVLDGLVMGDQAKANMDIPVSASDGVTLSDVAHAFNRTQAKHVATDYTRQWVVTDMKANNVTVKDMLRGLLVVKDHSREVA